MDDYVGWILGLLVVLFVGSIFWLEYKSIEECHQKICNIQGLTPRMTADQGCICVDVPRDK